MLGAQALSEFWQQVALPVVLAAGCLALSLHLHLLPSSCAAWVAAWRVLCQQPPCVDKTVGLVCWDTPSQALLKTMMQECSSAFLLSQCVYVWSQCVYVWNIGVVVVVGALSQHLIGVHGMQLPVLVA
jgi:hypothetical protein